MAARGTRLTSRLLATISIFLLAGSQTLAQTAVNRGSRVQEKHDSRTPSEHRLQHWPPCGPESLGNLLNRHPKLSAQGKVHLLLSTTPLAAIEMVYRPVFERILNEKVSTDPVKVVAR